MSPDQSEYELRCEWGLNGVLELAPNSDVIVIVDVLSFSTAVDIAVSRGATILPYRWKDNSAQKYADSKRAVLASDRLSRGAYSLSPAALERIPEGTVLVLPSPNGSTISLSTAGKPSFTACLRNAPTVAAQVRKRGSRIAVIPAGEHWSDGTLRPCLEDLVGAGAVLAELSGSLSPAAELAVAAFERFRHNLHDTIAHCSSGRDLMERGFARDVELACEYAVSASVPVLLEDRFVNGRL